jgi:hypothetical protein
MNAPSQLRGEPEHRPDAVMQAAMAGVTRAILSDQVD